MTSEELNELLNRAYRYSLSLAKNRDDAFDLVQDTYVKIVQNNKPLIISYFIISIRNKYIDNKRKEKLKHNYLEKNVIDLEYIPSFTPEPYLEKILLELKTKDREIIFLSIVEEYTAQEISDLMNIPRGTILSILARTKKKLKGKLKEKKSVI
ncbi:MAG: RNA polymerase sigma factor [Flavobacteriales bacterium]|nr:RNA polymerase sigma factor [Flavobacteriales bacterium]